LTILRLTAAVLYKPPFAEFVETKFGASGFHSDLSKIAAAGKNATLRERTEQSASHSKTANVHRITANRTQSHSSFP
jgi:hypothetical protein